MSTIVSADAVEAYLSGVDAGRIAAITYGRVTLTGGESSVFVPRLSESVDRFVSILGDESAGAGLRISVACAERFSAWFDAAITTALNLRDLAGAVRQAVAAGGAEIISGPDELAAAALQLMAMRRIFAPCERISPDQVRYVRQALGEIAVAVAESELDIMAWRLRRRAGRGVVRDLRLDEVEGVGLQTGHGARSPAPADGGEPVSECLWAVADFFGRYRETGAAIAAVTAAEFEELFRDMAVRARALEAAPAGTASPDAARDPRVWDAIAEATRDPGGNVALFPVVRRSPPRDPQPAA